jgi:hypothetical protein
VGDKTVDLFFPHHIAPERLVFVLKETQPDNWINNGNCFSIQVCVWVWVRVGVWWGWGAGGGLGVQGVQGVQGLLLE